MPACDCGFATSNEDIVRCPNCKTLFGDVIPPPPDHKVGEEDPMLATFNNVVPLLRDCAGCEQTLLPEDSEATYEGEHYHPYCLIDKLSAMKQPSPPDAA